MKKIIAILLALMLCVTPLAVFAHSDNTNAGTVPKTATAPVMDGVKDAIYNDGLHVPIRNPHSATPEGGLGGGGDAWLLWEDGFLYVFISVDVKSLDKNADYEDLQAEQPWALTDVEVLIDFSNASDSADDVCQFRMNDRGFPNVTIGRSAAWLNGEECRLYMDWGSTNTANSYTAEYKLKIAEIKKGMDDAGMDFGGAFGAGKQLGLYIFAQECSDDGTQALFVSVPTDQSGNWAPATYDYIVLGDKVVGAAAPAPEPEPEPVAAETPVVEAAPAVVVTPPPAPVAVKTGDAGIIALSVIMTIAAAGVVVLRKKAVK